MSPSASGLGPRKSKKVRRKIIFKKTHTHTLQTLSGDSPETSQTVPETFWRLFRVPGRRPRETCSRLFQHFGPGGPERPCKGRAGSQTFDLFRLLSGSPENRVLGFECLVQGAETSKVPKVVGRGCKRCFGRREHRSPKSLLHHPNPVLQRCNSLLHQCKRTLAPWVRKAFCTLS